MLRRCTTIALLVLCLGAPALARDAPCLVAKACADTLELSGGGTLSYYHSLPLAGSEAVVRALVVVHGNGRNADDYFDHAVAATRLERRTADTLVIAPAFRAGVDRPAPGEHYWSKGGWKVGDRSRDPKRVSSFAVMDELLERICGMRSRAFPKLGTVVIAGHSAGAQFVNRYLAGGAGCPDRAVEVRFLVMNPSSYLYVDGRRRTTPAAPFATPRTSCSGYDDYKYGLRELNAYMRRVGVDEIRRRLFTRRAWYVAGEADTGAGSSLDQSCAAMLQGPNRLARHANYRDYAGLFTDWSGAAFVTVPGVAHSGRDMLASEAARRITFR